MKSRDLSARLLALATSVLVLIGLASALDAGLAAAQGTPACASQPSRSSQGGAEANRGAIPAAPCNETPTEPPASGTPSECGCKPTFTIEKRQEIAGSGAGFTTSPLTGAIGERVDYEIIVQNTGLFAETFSDFTDPHCDAGTLAGGPGASSVAPGESTTYTCSHLLTAAGRYTNEASVTGVAFVGVPVTQTSNQVVVEVPPPNPPSVPHVSVPKAAVVNPVTPPSQMVGGACVASPPVLRGASGPKSGTFTAQVNSAGIKQVTFYLDGRKLKTLRTAQARHGNYSIGINPRTLAYGQHKLSVRTLPANVNCAAAARTGVFVRPRPQQAVARFAG